MAIALLTPLPTPPVATDTEAVFNSKADATLLAEKAFVDEMNSSTIPGINQAVADTQAARDAAAGSATAAEESADSAASQVGLAAGQKDLAVAARQGSEAARDEAEAFAQAAGAAVGPTPVPLTFLGADANGNVGWRPAGQAIGDTLITALATPPAGYLLPDTVYSKALYPELFAVVGTVGANLDLNNFSLVTLSFPNTPFRIAAGKDDVLIAVGNGTNQTAAGWCRRSTDGGLTWSSPATLNGINGLFEVATDGNGVWLAFGELGAVYRSSDNGLTWSRLPDSGVSFSAGSTAVTDKLGEWVVATSSSTVLRSSNNGATWFQWSYSGTFQSFSYCAYSGLWFRLNSTSTLVEYSKSLAIGGWVSVINMSTNLPVFSGAFGVMYTGSYMHVTNDGGLTWKISSTNMSYSNYLDSDGVLFLRNENSDNPRLLRSYDLGESYVSEVITGLLATLAINNANKRVAKLQNGTTVNMDSATQLRRSVRQYAYDTATQFKTPARKAPRGLKAYIKAKAA